MPGVIVKNIPPGVNDPPIVPRLCILHVDAGNAETLFGWFNGPSGGVESHFFVKKDGAIEQYRSIFWQADANLNANNFAVSIETQGRAAGEWTAAQLASIKRLIVWLHETADIPYEVCETWDGQGVGYHVMFGAPGPWTPSAKTCPGPDRIAQFKTILTPWLARKARPPRTIFPVVHRIVTANMFVNNPDPVRGVMRIIDRTTQAFKYGPDAIAMQETHRMLGKLERVGGYDLLYADEGEAGRELGVLLQSKLAASARTEFHPTVPGTGDGALDHPRGIFVVKYTKRGRKVAVVNTHAPVFGEDRMVDGDAPGPAALQHSAHAQKVVRTVERLKANGYTVFVCTDANSRGRWPESLPAVLEASGLKVVRDNVDLIAMDPKQVKAPEVEIVDRRLTGSDHHDAIAIRTTERRRA